MNKHTVIALSVASAVGLSPFVAGAFADEARTSDGKQTDGKQAKPATLAYPMTPNRTDATSMIGHAVEDINGNKVGAIEGIIIGKDGKVIGVGGFLGVGERDVLVKWPSIRMVKDTDAHLDKIVLSATRDQLKSMTAYKFERPDQRRTVFDAPM